MKGFDGYAPLMSLIINGGCAATVKLLVEAGANLRAEHHRHWAPIHAACSRTSPHLAWADRPLVAMNVITALIDHGADANHRASGDAKNWETLLGTGGQTPLWIASASGHAEAIKHLLQLEADVNAATHDRVTPLMVATAMYNPDVVKILIDAGADIDVRSNSRGAFTECAPCFPFGSGFGYRPTAFDIAYNQIYSVDDHGDTRRVLGALATKATAKKTLHLLREAGGRHLQCCQYVPTCCPDCTCPACLSAC